MGSLKKAVKKIAKPEVLLPIALIAATGGLGAGAAGAGAGAGAGAASGAGSSGIMSKLFGTAAKTAASKGAATGALKGALAKGAGSAKAAGLLKAGTTTIPGTAGILGAKGVFAPFSGTLARGAMYGLKNPLTKQGLATYGTGAGLLGLMMGKDKTEAQKNLNTDPQAVYDMGRLMNKQMGGAYTDEELNTYMAPLLSQYGGKYQIADKAPERKRRMMYPGLNYSGLTRYAADGGAIFGNDELRELGDDELRELIEAIPSPSQRKARQEKEQQRMSERLENINQMQQERERQKIEEEAFRLMMGEQMSDNEPIIMGPETYNTGRANGGIMMALGGSVPQTNNIPQGMQIDGRGGGFIPMGAQEKHDDVPAMLAKNEFVMTSDAVKAAGGGSVNKGAQAMYDLMHSLESKV